MKKILIILSLIILLGCDLFTPETINDRDGSINLSLTRSLNQPVTILLTHSDGTIVEREVTQTALIDKLKIGVWTINASVVDSVGTEIYSGSGSATVEAGKVINFTLNIYPKGSGTIEFDISLGDAIGSEVIVSAIDQRDTSKITELFRGVVSTNNYTTGPINIAAGIYEIIYSVKKDNAIIGGMSEMVIITNGETISKINTIPTSSQFSIPDNSVFRLYTKSVTGNSSGIVSGRYLTYTLNNNAYDLVYTDHFKSYPKDSAQSCLYYVYGEKDSVGNSKKVKLNISSGTYTGEIIFTFGSEDKGEFIFVTTTGDIIEGTFSYLLSPKSSMMDYFFYDNPEVLIDFGQKNSAEISGIYKQSFFPTLTGYDHTFYPQPVVDFTSQPTTSDKTIFSGNQIHNPEVVSIEDLSGTTDKKYKVTFSQYGVSGSYIIYNFLSNTKGIAEYNFRGEQGQLVSGIASFNFSNFRGLPYQRDISGVYEIEYRKTWSYIENYNTGSEDIFSPYFIKDYYVNSDIAIMKFYNKLDIHNQMAIHFNQDKAIIGEAARRVFDDCDILGRDGDYLIIKGKYVNASSSDLLFGLNTGLLNNNDTVYIRYNVVSYNLEVFKESADYVSLFTNPVVSLNPTIALNSSAIPQDMVSDENGNLYISYNGGVEKVNLAAKTSTYTSRVGDGNDIDYLNKSVGDINTQGEYIVITDTAENNVSIYKNDLTASIYDIPFVLPIKADISLFVEDRFYFHIIGKEATANLRSYRSFDPINFDPVTDQIGSLDVPGANSFYVKVSNVGYNDIYTGFNKSDLRLDSIDQSDNSYFNPKISDNNSKKDNDFTDMIDFWDNGEFLAIVGSGAVDSSRGFSVYDASSVYTPRFEIELWHNDGTCGTDNYKGIDIYTNPGTSKVYAIIADGKDGIKIYSSLTTNPPTLEYHYPLPGITSKVYVDANNIYALNYTNPVTTNRIVVIPHTLP